jgi:uncharacterized protein YjdB
MTMTVEAVPSAGTIVGSATVCSGGSVTLTDAAVGGTWSATNGSATVTGGVVTAVTSGLDTIVYSVTNGFCNSSTWMAINVGPVLATISGPTSVCAGSHITLTDATLGGFWGTSSPSVAGVSGTGVVSAIAAGSDTITYAVVTSCGTLTTTRVITVNPLPNAGSISGASAVCVGGMTVLTDGATGGTWAASNTHGTLSLDTVTGHTAGIDTISYTVTNGCGTAVATHVINVDTMIYAGPITGPSHLCISSTITLGGAVTGGTWMASNGNVADTGAVLTGVAYGVDTISYIVSNVCGTDTAHKVVIVDTLAPIVGAITGLHEVCLGAHITLVDTGASIVGNWHSSTPSLATIGTTTGIVTGISIGIDTITYRVSNGCGFAVAPYMVHVNSLPNPGHITGPDSVCQGSTVILMDPVATGTWSVSDVSIATIDASGNLHGLSIGPIMVTYTVTNSCGTAIDTMHFTVDGEAVPILNLSGTTIICQGQSITLGDGTTGGNWSSSAPFTALTLPVTGFALVIGLVPGVATITYAVTNACGPSSVTLDVSVEVCGTNTGVANTAAIENSIMTLPNPSNGSFYLTFNSADNSPVSVSISNMMGQTVSQIMVTPNVETGVKLDQPAGIYFVSAATKNGVVSTKVVVE